MASGGIINRTYLIQGKSLKCLDFSRATAVPSLTSTRLDIPSDCEIRVPASLVDSWKAATNWASYADHIVGV